MKKLITTVFMLLLSSVLFADPDPEVSLTVETFGTVYTQPFNVTVKFTEPVTGFGFTELTATNALITSVTGGPSNYIVTLIPKIPGPMEIFVPAGVVRSLTTGTSNKASNKLKMNALDPVLNPSTNFNLTQWSLVLPIPLGALGEAITISNATLVGLPAINTGYTNPPYFYTDNTKGSMNFFAPLNGATTPGSVNPRSELSEYFHVRGLPLAWTFTTFETNVLQASLVVTQVPPSKKIIIGKIQGKGNSDGSDQLVASKALVKIYYDLSPFDPNGGICNGCVYTSIRPIPAQEIYLKTITLANNVPLNKAFQYKITLLRDGTLTVRVGDNKINDKSFSYSVNTSLDNTVGWGSQKLLFKAGVYILGNGLSSSQGGAANFYSLNIKHLGCPYIP